MKTINKVLETMLSKPATPTWTASATRSAVRANASTHFDAPTNVWSWGG